MSFSRNATRAESEEGRLFSQATLVTKQQRELFLNTDPDPIHVTKHEDGSGLTEVFV